MIHVKSAVFAYIFRIGTRRCGNAFPAGKERPAKRIDEERMRSDMLNDTIRAVKDAEAEAAARIAAAKQEVRAKIAAATADAAAAETAAAAQAKAAQIAAVQAAKEAGERRVLDARGLAKASADAADAIIKKKAADAAEEILGGIREQWQ